MLVGSIIGAIIGIALSTVVYSILIFIVGKLEVGMKVDKFSSAILAGLLVAIGGAIAAWLSTLLNAPAAVGVAGAIMHLIIAAAMLKAIGASLKGVEVKGWGGAFLAALAIAVIGWLINFGLTAFNAA